MRNKKQIKVKICGITELSEIKVINEVLPDYIGMVLFCESSKRNISLEKAKELLKALDPRVLAVAVVVAPNLEQVTAIQELGFHMIQIHKEVTQEVLEHISLPIWKAYHMNQEDIDLLTHPSIMGYVIDSVNPGSGQIFDWEEALDIKTYGKLFILAGGLHEGNIHDAIFLLHPDVVDVSSGVERKDGNGKDGEKIKTFIEKVRSYE
ncbi:MAG TPA: phosphoribosylanthranilate isomerase [Candidatus Merdenecus merdavium]|nr:phosphoribosylanthranilate isomerase [Candidatus Merdenecus merdavium]